MSHVEAETAKTNEDDELLSFIENLDYDEYIRDIEVKEAMKFVKERVKQIEKDEEKEQHDDDDDDDEEIDEEYDEDEVNDVGDIVKVTKTRKIRRPRVQSQRLIITPSEPTQSPPSQRAVATSILQQNTALRNIHSSASMRAMMEKTKMEGQTRFPAIANGTHEPKIVMHDANATQKKEVDVSNLPFLYRHPGI